MPATDTQNQISHAKYRGKHLKSFDEFLRLHNQRKSKDHQRLGQRFCFMYVKDKWPDLFYADFPKAKDLIQLWLSEHHYVDELPHLTDAEIRIAKLREHFGKFSN